MYKECCHNNRAETLGGLTLVETLVVIALSLFLIAAATPIYSGFFTKSKIDERLDELAQTLWIARGRSAARVDNLAHGVYFVIDPTGPDSYILYEGASYAPSPNERIIELDDSFSLSTTLAGDDINFSRGAAAPNTTGTVLLTQGAGETRTMRINQYGGIAKE